jgi:hypothetical protein
MERPFFFLAKTPVFLPLFCYFHSPPCFGGLKKKTLFKINNFILKKDLQQAFFKIMYFCNEVIQIFKVLMGVYLNFHRTPAPFLGEPMNSIPALSKALLSASSVFA